MYRHLFSRAGTQFLDYVIVNDQRVTAAQLAQYNEKGSMPVTPDIKKIERLGIQVIPTRLISNKDLVRHNPQKLQRVIISLVYRLLFICKGIQFFVYLLYAASMRELRKIDISIIL